MPSPSGKFDNHKGLIINVGIMQLGDEASSATNPFIQFNALIDTGASHTCISEEVVRAVGLQPIGKRSVISATHSVAVNVYLANLIIPFGKTVFFKRGIELVEFVAPSPPPHSNMSIYQLLLGRDIICQGALTLSFDGHFTLSL
jgi:predicted aspartyl protease